ncbi:MAG: hypothetical protein ACRESS_07335 [Stenotrophobium sp.]
MRVWSAGIALIAVCVAASLLVVCLQFYMYMATEPRLQHEWPALLQDTLGFCALSAIGVAALWLTLKQRRGMWAMQAALLLGIVAVSWLSRRLLMT